MEVAVLDHEEARLLLPWLGTDRLEAAELEALLDHLKVCRACRAELRDLAELGRFAELAERGEAPDAAAIDQRLAGLLARLDEPRPGSARSAARPLGKAQRAGLLAFEPWRRALPLAALVLVAVGFLWLTSRDPAPPAGPYTTLSSPKVAAPAGPALRVVVADACRQDELRALLLLAGAEIRGGPSRHGAYEVRLPVGAAREPVIAAWREASCFSFVDKAAGAEVGQ